MTTSRTIRPALMGMGAIALAVVAQVRLQEGFTFDAALLFTLAVTLFLTAFGWRNGAELTARVPAPRHTRGFGRRVWTTWLGIGLLLTAGVLAWLSWQEFLAREPDSLTGWWYHLGSIGACLLGAYVLDGARVVADLRIGLARLRHWQRAGEDELAPRTVLLWLLLILALSGFPRFWRFDSLPFGIWYDEANHALQAQRILDTAGYWPLFQGAVHAPAHYLYLVALSFRLFGTSIEALRAVSAVMGLAAVLAAYFLGRELFDQRAGLVLAFLLAVSSWAVTLSRFGMFATISTPLFTLGSAYFLVRALRALRMSDFAWAGLWLGLGLCFYTSFRLFVAVVGLFLLFYLLMTTLRDRRLPPVQWWIGLGFLALVAGAVVLPLAVFAHKYPELFWSRVQDTFIFAGKAADERWPALWENVRRHVFMFNLRGDPNGRHNLPGAPMLDAISAACMVLGLALALWRWRDPIWLLLPLWLAGALLGGILSLDFEAPQSLRANGTLPVVYVLAVVPIFVTGRAWRRGDGRYFPNALVVPLIVLLLLPSGVLNYRRYFVEQATDFSSWAAFSTAETITGQLLADLDPQTDAYVISFYHGHPTLNFLAGYDASYHNLETTDHLPLAFAENRGALLILDAERRALFDEAQRIYPNAEFVEHRAPFGGPPVLFSVRLSAADVASVEGLDGVYFAGADWQGVPLTARRDRDFSLDWTMDAPLQPPFSVEWSGVLRAEDYGLYQFFVQAAGPTELLINETRVVHGTGDLTGGLVLAEGNHPIRIRTSVVDAGAPGEFRLFWRPPAQAAGLLPPTALYSAPVRSNGLLGRYFPNGGWAEPDSFARIEPQIALYFHNPPLPRPYTVEWQGKLAIPQAGRYRLGLSSIDESILLIHGEEIAASPDPNAYGEGAIDLDEGLHDILIRYADRTDHTNITLYWTPPWGDREPVPAQALVPPQARYDRVVLPSLAQLVDQPAGGFLSTLPFTGALPDVFETLYAGLAAPRGVGVSDEGRVFIADTDGADLLILDAAGSLQARVRGPGATADDVVPFGAPFDVAVAPLGWAYVLDASAATLTVYDRNGAYVTAVDADRALFDRARGLTVAPDGTIWVAQTPTGRIVVLEPNGTLVRELPVWPGEAAQPVDVAVAADGTIYVVDAARYRVIRYDAEGRRLLAWELPRFDSIDSSKVAVDDHGLIYVSIPEEAAVWVFGPDGQRVVTWAVPSTSGVPARPVGIAVGADGAVLVTDVANGQVVRFYTGG